MSARPAILRTAAVAVAFFAASASALAIPIAATPISPLSFGQRVQGDLATTVAAGTTETPQNASIAVSGDANTAYSIILPGGPITLTTGGGAANEQLTVTSLTSFPAPGLNGQLNAAGTQTLYIGGTLSGLLANQAPGSYTGSMTVTVSY